MNNRGHLLCLLAIRTRIVDSKRLASILTECADVPTADVESHLLERLPTSAAEATTLDFLMEQQIARFAGDVGLAVESLRAAPAIRSQAREFVDLFSADTTLGQAADDEGDAKSRPLERLGEYEILRQLGSGGMGTVYLARHATLHRTVALKVISGGRFLSREDETRFRAEAEAAAGLDHPGIAAVYEAGFADGHHFYAMRFVDGLSLAAYLQQNGVPPISEAVRWIHSVALAISYAHGVGVIHRDLKPANIMLDHLGHPQIVDFGLAKRVAATDDLTMTGQIMGTPSYMAPEQAKGETKHVGPAADIYALGAVLYELLTGQRPFSGSCALDVLELVRSSPAPSPRSRNRHIPRDLETVCLKCLEKNPRARYATAELVADELQRFLEHRPIQARRISFANRSVRWCHRNPWIAVFLAVLVASTVGLTILTAQLARQFQRTSATLQQQVSTINELLVRISEDDLLAIPNAQNLRRDLLGKAEEYCRRALATRADHPGLEDSYAQVQNLYGVIQSKIAASAEQKTDALTQLTRAEQSLRDLLERSGNTNAIDFDNAVLAYSPTTTHESRWRDHLSHLDRESIVRLLRQEALTNNLISQARLTTDPATQLSLAERVLALRAEIRAACPQDPEANRKLAGAHNNVSIALCASQPSPGRRNPIGEAIEHLETAQRIRQAWQGTSPELALDWIKGEYALACALERQARQLHQPDSTHSDASPATKAAEKGLRHYSDAVAGCEQLRTARDIRRIASDLALNHAVVLRERALFVLEWGLHETPERFAQCQTDLREAHRLLKTESTANPDVVDCAKEYFVSVAALYRFIYDYGEPSELRESGDDLSAAITLAAEKTAVNPREFGPAYAEMLTAATLIAEELGDQDRAAALRNQARQWAQASPEVAISAETREILGLPANSN